MSKAVVSGIQSSGVVDILGIARKKYATGSWYPHWNNRTQVLTLYSAGHRYRAWIFTWVVAKRVCSDWWPDSTVFGHHAGHQLWTQANFNYDHVRVLLPYGLVYSRANQGCLHLGNVYVINQISLLFILRILWQNRACMSKYCPIYGQAKWPFDTSLIRMYPKILYFISIKIIQDQYTLLPLLGRSM